MRYYQYSRPHRRYLKAHLPFDALPVYEAWNSFTLGAMPPVSFHNHFANFRADVIRRYNELSRADERFGDDWLPKVLRSSSRTGLPMEAVRLETKAHRSSA